MSLCFVMLYAYTYIMIKMAQILGFVDIEKSIEVEIKSRKFHKCLPNVDFRQAFRTYNSC